MKLVNGIMKPYCNNIFMMKYCSSQCVAATMPNSKPYKATADDASNRLKIATSSWNNANSSSRVAKVSDKWMEFQGIKNWEGLLDPLDDGLRDEILRYGGFVEAAYCCFDFDTSSSGYGTCRYPKASMLAECGINNYKVTKNLHATCGVQLPDWTDERIPSWVSTRSSWIGYMAICTDKNEIRRLGRRDVVIAYRGTVTVMEWLENLRATLTCLPDHMSPDIEYCDSRVQSGFLSLYTSSVDSTPSLRDSIREEINKILQKYADEPLSITVTGHSLGAALATLTAHDITTTFKHTPLVTAVSFGGPRVGNKSFRCQLEKSGTKVLRIVNSDDPITRVPGFVLDQEKTAKILSNWLRQWVYAEVGKELRLSSKDCPHLSNGNIATCHDLKTYLHLVDSFVSSSCPLRATAKRVLNIAQHDQKQKLAFGLEN